MGLFFRYLSLFVFVVLGSTLPCPLQAQNEWTQDFSNMMRIPSVMAVESSPAHMYVLSRQEGLIVFRAGADSLQWLYSSPGMEQRGDRLQADIRFAYLYGDSRRLTIVEPTSVLGVYSSTSLPGQPLSVQRLGNSIYIAMGSDGLGRLSLESPDHVDREPEMLFEESLEGREVIDLASDHSTYLYLLTNRRELFILNRTDAEETVEHVRTVDIERSVERLFLTKDELIGANSRGEIFLIDSNGGTRIIADVGESVRKVRMWEDLIVAGTENGELWAGEPGRRPELWKDDPDRGNYFTVMNNRLWVTDFDQVSPVLQAGSGNAGENATGAAGNRFPEIKEIENVTIPYPRPVILPLELESDHRPDQVEFSYRSNVQNAKIRGQSLYWQPAPDQIGRNRFTIIASTATGEVDTLSFLVDVRPFNTPPRFTPLRPVTISVGEEFTMEMNAVDPDGMDSRLIRYLGVDLPEGAALDEQTGMFRWTPGIRQIGETEFQVIATDQFGAAASRNVELRVIETDPDAEADLDS